MTVGTGTFKAIAQIKVTENVHPTRRAFPTSASTPDPFSLGLRIIRISHTLRTQTAAYNLRLTWVIVVGDIHVPHLRLIIPVSPCPPTSCLHLQGRQGTTAAMGGYQRRPVAVGAGGRRASFRRLRAEAWWRRRGTPEAGGGAAPKCCRARI